MFLYLATMLDNCAKQGIYGCRLVDEGVARVTYHEHRERIIVMFSMSPVLSNLNLLHGSLKNAKLPSFPFKRAQLRYSLLTTE